MVSFLEQIRILLWKNWLLRKRDKKRVIIEILWPLALFAILWWVRTRGLKYKESSCHLIEKAMPSVGGFEFFQNYICTLNNTCYDDYVENTDSSRWDDAIFVKFIKDTTPILNDILSNDESRSTITQLWQDVMDLMKIVSSFQNADNIRNIGSLQLRDYMNPDGLAKFYQAFETYTGLTREDADEFLNIKINLDKVQQNNFDDLLDVFRNQKCDNAGTIELLSFSSQKSFQKFCELGQDKLLMILFVYGNYMDRDALLKRMNGVMSAEQKVENLQKIMPITGQQYDFTTIGKLGKLGRNALDMGKVFNGINNLTGTEMASIFAYQGICGFKQKGNRSIFGFDPGLPSRFDSLRDQLRAIWKSDNHYENDPEISPACNAVFQRLESLPITSFMWRQVKPIVRGYIFYSPDTEVTRTIMGKVEDAFGKLQEMEYTVNSILQLLHRVRLWMHENLDDLNNIKAFLGNRTNIDGVIRTFGLTLSTEERERVYKASESLDVMSIEGSLEKLDFASELLSEIVGCVRYNKTKAFPSEWEAVNAGHALLPAEKLWAVVVFLNADEDETKSDNSSFPPHIYYKIRMDSDKVDGTRAVRDRLTSKGPRRRPLFDLKYITFGFVYLQEMIERGIVEIITGQNLSQEQVFLQQYPYPCYIVDQFIRRISRTFPMLMVLSWVYASAMIIKSIVLEKERRLREVMKIMGVSNSAVWISWFMESFIIMFVSCSLLTLILKLGKILEFSSATLIWVFLISYTVVTICFSFFISTFFSRANSAAAAGGVIFFVSHLPYNMMLIWEERLEWFETLAGCLLSNVAFGFGCTYFARYEQDGIGAQWDNMSWRSLPGDDFNLAYCIAMMWVDSLFYLLLTFYVEAVFPGEYGVPKPWNFFMLPSYWVKPKPKLNQSNTNLSEATTNGRIFSNGAVVVFAKPSRSVNKLINWKHNDLSYLDGMEPDPDTEKCGVKITNLCKTYSNGKIALDNLTVNFYENQITSFLGHNGAGKTTTISILTGLFPPTDGSAIINGMDIRSDMDHIRRNLGICPQYNVLFDRLNVYEHLQFYALLKGKKGKDVENEFNEMLADLGIPHKWNSYPSSLSGGMKRKLSVAIAFVGGSKTVFLDEPTSGVDPFSRRSIWELLLKYKTGRTVILTTHFMDEADILGDRIAIISQGKLKALGSSLFLKSHFGQGYTLHLVKNEDFLSPTDSSESNDSQETRKTIARHDIIIGKFVREAIPSAIITENVGSEVAFLLPYETIANFSTLFSQLKENSDSIGILSYGISDTSLEDVFLKITMADVMANMESFHVLNSGCKRRLMRILSRCKNSMSYRRNVVTTLAPRDPSASTNTTGISIQPFCSPVGAFARNFDDDVDLEEKETKYSDRSTLASFPDRKSRDVSYGDVVSSVSDIEAVTTSLLDEPLDDEPQKSTLLDNFKCAWSCSFTCCLWYIQIYMINKKRLWNSKRNKKAMFFEIILPAVFIAITLAFTLILPPASDEPPREVTPWTYESPNYIFYSEPNITRRRGVPNEFRTVLNELIGPVGMSTACLEDRKTSFCDSSKYKNSSVQEFNNSRLSFYGAHFDSCSCDIGSLHCPDSVNKVTFPKLKTQTNDFILDVSNTNIPEWIMKTYDKYMDSRYGGFELQIRKPNVASMASYLSLLNNLTTLIPLPRLESDRHGHEKVFATETPLPSLKYRRAYKVWYENRGWISSVAYLNALHNMWLRGWLPEQFKDQKANYGITLIMHPMNLTKHQSNQESLKTAGLGVIHAICIIFALSFIPASFTVYLIEERKCGGKHLHLVSGVRPLTYWISNFLFDMGKYIVPTVLCVILFVLFDAKAYIGKASFWPFVCLLLLYGWASIPSMYPFSFLFGVPSTAFVVLACSNLFIGVITTVTTFVLEHFGDDELEAVGKILEKVFLIFPHYCLGMGCVELVEIHAVDTGLSELSKSNRTQETNRFEWDHLGEKLFFLAVHGFVYFLLNLVIEYRHLPMMLLKLIPTKKMIKTDEDTDVTEERLRIENSNREDMTLCAMGLTKYYKGKKHPAVNGITFGCKKGECFGLLGVNGAGKSSTFKMLTGDARVSSGGAKICGADVEKSLDKARKHFGYCPQEDSIDPLLSGYELLILYGRLRGLSPTDTQIAAERLIKSLGLSKYAFRSSGTYSGGNKRKLSTAIALIGDPEVIFLDEPTSGMDPGARRDLWKVILDLLRIGKTVVLTSHSMEECEVLCTKIAIMVNGQFKCIGSLQHLKNRFGKGYTLTIRCVPNFGEVLLKRISDDLPTATVEDQHCSQLKFNIPQESAHLNEIFSTLSGYKNESIIEDYSVSQTTLDDIFVRFASDQKDSLDR